MIVNLYKIMRESILAVNNDKTQIMCLAEKMKITVEGHEIEEMEHGTVLELTDIVSLAHNVSLWALKLTHSVSFWAQKLTHYVSF